MFEYGLNIHIKGGKGLAAQPALIRGAELPPAQAKLSMVAQACDLRNTWGFSAKALQTN